MTDQQCLATNTPPPPPPPPILPSRLPGVVEQSEYAKPSVEFDVKNEVVELFSKKWEYIANGTEDIKLLYLYNHVTSIIQKGPTCGLVALAMASERMEVAVQATPKRLLEVAADAGYTNQGEMFSALNMATLAEKELSVLTEIRENLNERKEELIQHLSKGWTVLVPYDADANHEPCLKSGHKAHWAILLGFCLTFKKSHYFSEQNTCKEEIEQISDDVYSLKSGSLPEAVLRVVQSGDYEQFFVLAKQGKSKHLQLFDFNQLCRSNCNLMEVNKDKCNVKQFVLPPNGSLEGLCNKTIFVKPIFEEIKK